MMVEGLTPEQQEKAKGCKSAEDILALAAEEGYKLSDEELEYVSGGDWGCQNVCSGFTDDAPHGISGFFC